MTQLFSGKPDTWAKNFANNPTGKLQAERQGARHIGDTADIDALIALYESVAGFKDADPTPRVLGAESEGALYADRACSCNK